jgi:hypothetical protein
VTAPSEKGDKAPAWNKTAAEEAENAHVGSQAAGMIGAAVLGMGGSANPWAAILGTVMRSKPHKSGDKAYQQLLKVQEQDGKLKLMHFRRVKQLGAGDVGLVDLVQLQGTDFKFAMKTLDKHEMQERNKVQRVLTEAQVGDPSEFRLRGGKVTQETECEVEDGLGETAMCTYFLSLLDCLFDSAFVGALTIISIDPYETLTCHLLLQ